MNLKKFLKYKPAFDYITANRPMHIVEFGGGESTYYLNEHLTNLGYGGKVTAFENSQEFFDYAHEKGWDESGSIKLADVEIKDPVRGIVSYIHSFEGLEDVDFIIVDGPDYRVFRQTNGDPSSITDNIQVMREHFDRDIPFWIEGRNGTQQACRNLGYKMITDWDVWE
jgi:hypothetical protein